MRPLAGLVVVTACGFTGKGASVDDAPPNDLAPPGDEVVLVDGTSDGLPQCEAWMPRNITDLCMRGTPTPGDFVIDGSETFDTDTQTFASGVTPPTVFTQDQGVEATVLYVEGFRITATGSLRVVGSRPLIILGVNGVTIEGRLDASSDGATLVGAGGNPMSCTATRAASGASDDTGGGSGGGGGGGFRGVGGNGGPGDSPIPNPGGMGGATVTLTGALRGGCSGATSGAAGNDGQVASPATATTRTPGGHGGGAVQLSSAERIVLGGQARIDVGGGGGGGAVDNSANGGGGGGAGGMAALDAPVLEAAPGARIAANGGGGGAGAAFANPSAGGEDARDDMTMANGGQSNDSCAPSGGRGGFGATPDGGNANTVSLACGGGGGGGGVGFVVVFGTASDPDLQASPSIISLP